MCGSGNAYQGLTALHCCCCGCCWYEHAASTAAAVAAVVAPVLAALICTTVADTLSLDSSTCCIGQKYRILSITLLVHGNTIDIK
jgi:hypothetical protein